MPEKIIAVLYYNYNKGQVSFIHYSNTNYRKKIIQGPNRLGEFDCLYVLWLK